MLNPTENKIQSVTILVEHFLICRGVTSDQLLNRLLHHHLRAA